MKEQSTRRKFLTAIGVTGISPLAGCSSIPGLGNAPMNSQMNGSGTTSPDIDGKNGTKNATNEPYSRGTVVDDFEGDVDSRWGINDGKYKTTTHDVFQGTQSLVVEPGTSAKQPVAKIFKSFYPDTLDLSKHDLSLAVKVNKPEDIKISAEIIAPAKSSMLTSTRYIPLELDGWVRFDLGYTGKTGEPTMDSVSEIRLQIGPIDNQFQVLIDDLRKIPKATKGKVMFQFDDGHITAYEEAYPILDEKGWPGSIAVVPDAVNGNDRVTDQMMQEMGNEGWDMIGHASELLPKRSEPKQRRILQQAQQYLSVKGFKNGARHFVAPYSRVNQTTLNLIDEIFETGYLFGGCPNNAQHPSNPSFISRVQGSDVQGAQHVLDVADELNQLVVISYHVLGSGDDAIPTSALEQIVDHVEKKDMDIITPSQLIDGSE
ncbi:polysaccharide deacetylase family protein [Halocatena marina]|uniref:polysaccharide deacetylase family protein n=1 Tax=Halocatena marina TaxID=2934937 RepID=UPI00200E1235|nr:polysaccharide deacetylase family protein [Halocatena marina]